jgi:zinc protease
MKILTFFSALFLVSCLPVQAEERFLDIQEVASKNGIKAWLVEDKSLPIIALKFSFKGAGSIRDGQNKQGLARLLSNTMDEGAGDIKSHEFQKILSDNSITLGFGAGRDNFGGQLKTLSRNKETAFNLLKLALTQPRFDEAPLTRMRQSNLSRIRSSMGNPDWIAARIFNDKAFDNHPYALNSGGTLTTLKNITSNDLRAHVKDWLTQDRLHIGVMGDISKNELAKILDQIFGDLPKQGRTDKIATLALQNTGKTFIYDQDIPQTILSMTLPSITPQNPDYYALQVMNYIFGAGGFGSRLMEEAREKRGLTYGIYSSTSHQDYIDLFTISTSTKNKSVQEIIDIIDEEILRIQSKEVSTEELVDSKSYLTGSMPLSLSSSSKIANILLSLQLNNRPIDYLDNYNKKINVVTIKDVQKIAQRLLNTKNMMRVMVGKPENIKAYEKIEGLPNVE